MQAAYAGAMHMCVSTRYSTPALREWVGVRDAVHVRWACCCLAAGWGQLLCTQLLYIWLSHEGGTAKGMS